MITAIFNDVVAIKLGVSPGASGFALGLLLACIPLAAHIRRILHEGANRMAPRSRFLDELEDHMTAKVAGKKD